MQETEMLIPRIQSAVQVGRHRGTSGIERERVVEALVETGSWLTSQGYRFATVTPRTQASVLRRRGVASGLTDIFGWNRIFDRDLLPRSVFASLRATGFLMPTGRNWSSALRFSSLGSSLYAHSGYPTHAPDSVFFGPDSQRFVAALLRFVPRCDRLVDNPLCVHGTLPANVASGLAITRDPSEVSWESLALGNLMAGMALDRDYAYHAVGALGVIELTAPGRVSLVNAGMQRLGVPASARRYFELHASLDKEHSEAWNREVIHTLVASDPRLAAPLAEGALMRLAAGQRCFEAYRAHFGIATYSSD